MLIVMKQNATPEQVEAVVERIRSLGRQPQRRIMLAKMVNITTLRVIPVPKTGETAVIKEVVRIYFMFA